MNQYARQKKMFMTLRYVEELTNTTARRNELVNAFIYSQNYRIEEAQNAANVIAQIKTLYGRSDHAIREVLSLNSINGRYTDTLRYIRSQLQHQKMRELSLIRLTRELGFKNKGMIGTMRETAHELERTQAHNELLLLLRRHEKDFLLRGEQAYMTAFDKTAEEYRKVIQNESGKKLLARYRKRFHAICEAYLKLGKSGEQDGYLQFYDQSRQKIEHAAFFIRNGIIKESGKLSQNAGNLNLIFVTVLSIFGLLLAFYLSNLIRNYVVRLHNQVERFMRSERNELNLHELKIPNNEFGKLTIKVFRLMRRIKSDVVLLETRVEKRTEEIQFQKEVIQKQHSEMLQSLEFAARIQELILPQKFYYDQIFGEVNIFYRPKALVGGDFYRFHEMTDSDRNYKYAIIADCTGHGVPGAFLSVLGMNYLNDILNRHYLPPAVILHLLLAHFEQALNHSMDSLKYLSVDVLICCIDTDKRELVYAGTNANGFIYGPRGIRNFEKTRRLEVSYSGTVHSRFEEKQLKLSENDRVFLYTDGLTDQFGGKKGKKLTRRKLLEKIAEKKPVSGNAMAEEVQQIFTNWQGDHEQTDDVSFITFRPVRSTAQREPGDAEESMHTYVSR